MPPRRRPARGWRGAAGRRPRPCDERWARPYRGARHRLTLRRPMPRREPLMRSRRRSLDLLDPEWAGAVLGTSRLHELHESKFPFVSRIKFIRSKLSNFSAHASGIVDW